MCGIFGVYDKYLNKSLAVKSLEKLYHRGPDNISFFIKKDIFLGHTRLSIIDLTPNANQPLETDRFVIVYNGEVYNYWQLREKYLKEYKFSSNSDTEVILYMFDKFGVESPKYFNGMFSFCIFDKEDKILYLFRDRFGKKPLYYYDDGSKFIFSSEIKSIKSYLQKTLDINKAAFIQYLQFWSTFPPDTFYKNIKKLPQGSYLTFDINKHKLSLNKYFDLYDEAFNSCDDDTKFNEFQEEDLLKRIEQLILSSVESRLIADVNVATFLSGGIDSSLVTAVYSKLKNEKISAFSIGYKEHKHYDELKYAQKVAQYLNIDHFRYEVGKKDFLETIDKVIYYLDEPVSDPACIPTFILSEKVKENNIKVILTGEGSDEIFFGYDNYLKMNDFYNLSEKISDDEKKYLLHYHFNQFNLTKEWEYFRRSFSNEIIYKSNGENFTYFQLKELFKYDFLNSFPKELFTIEHFLPKAIKIKDSLNQMSYVDLSIWIPEVLMTKIDRMTMANSVEARAPFLDYRLVLFMSKLNSKLKIKDRTSKYLLKKIAVKYLPEEIVYRKKKGFSSPFLEWILESEGKNVLNNLINLNKSLGWFNDNFLEFLFFEGQKGRFKLHLWSLILFEKWFKKIY